MTLTTEPVTDLVLIIDAEQGSLTLNRQTKFGFTRDGRRFKDRFDHIEQVEKNQQQSHQNQDTPGGDTDAG